MRLDRRICLGGHYNNKEIIGIRLNKHNILIKSVYKPDGPYNSYLIYLPDSYASYMFKVAGSSSNFITENKRLTDWGDGTVDEDYTHNSSYYSNGGYYIISSTRFLEGDQYIKKVLSIRPDIINGSGIFSGYVNIKTEDLLLPDTSSMTKMIWMFCNCKSLTTLNLSSFDTSKVVDMYGIFELCSNLQSLDLSNFNMTNVTNTHNMFYDCSQLHTLRLDNCNYDTINKIINSGNFPTGTIDGVIRKIYVKKSNAGDLEPPTNWEFEYIPDVSYDEPTEALLVPDSMTQEADEQLTINQATYDPDNENLNI